MPNVYFRFYAELNDNLPPDQQYVEFSQVFDEGSTLEGAIQSLGVPIREIELLVMGKESVSLSHVLKDGDRVSVYPVFDSFDVGPITKIEDRPPRRVSFILDVHLGKLAHLLRMLGFDASYQNDYTRDMLLNQARREDRILLSKGKGITGEPDLLAAYRVKSSDPREQLVEILRRFDLWKAVRPFQRCLICNLLLTPVQKGEIFGHLPPKVRNLDCTFTKCPNCDRVYWKGTHVLRMVEFIDRMFAEYGH
jgi:uncharacterized protein with PIN domain